MYMGTREANYLAPRAPPAPFVFERVPHTQLLEWVQPAALLQVRKLEEEQLSQK